MKEKAVADAEALKEKHRFQRQEIEQVTEERDGALLKLEKLQDTFRGCFSEDGPGVSCFVRLGSKFVLNQITRDRIVICGRENT